MSLFAKASKITTNKEGENKAAKNNPQKLKKAMLF
jgi:hypothetical protein